MGTVTWSAIHLGNFADMDTNESNTTAENASALIGTYGSASDRLARHVTEITSDTSGGNVVNLDHGRDGDGDPFDPEFVSYDIGGGTQTAQLDTAALVTGTVTYTDGTTETMNLGVVQDDEGNVFLLISDSQTSLAAKPIESLQITSVDNTNYSAVNQDTRDDLQFVCFAPGTGILTPEGERAVESLASGDLVVTMDSGPQPVLWVGCRTLDFSRSPSDQKPVLVPAGALGPGTPRRPLVISPQHRVLLGSAEVRRRHGYDQALGPVKGLIGVNGIRKMAGKRRITYHTLLLRRHHVIRAEGAPVESFLPGPHAMRLLDPRQRTQVHAVLPLVRFFPEIGYGPPARPLLRRRQVADLGRLALPGTSVQTTASCGTATYPFALDTARDLV